VNFIGMSNKLFLLNVFHKELGHLIVWCWYTNLECKYGPGKWEFLGRRF
jgi:hypothetical protein